MTSEGRTPGRTTITGLPIAKPARSVIVVPRMSVVPDHRVPSDGLALSHPGCGSGPSHSQRRRTTQRTRSDSASLGTVRTAAAKPPRFFSRPLLQIIATCTLIP